MSAKWPGGRCSTSAERKLGAPPTKGGESLPRTPQECLAPARGPGGRRPPELLLLGSQWLPWPPQAWGWLRGCHHWVSAKINNVQVSPPPIRVLCACGVTRSSRLLTPLKRVATERPLHAEAVHRRLGEGRCSSISIGEASRGRACSRACCHHQLLACRGRSRG